MLKRGANELFILKLGDEGRGRMLVVALFVLLLIRLSREGTGGREGTLLLAEEIPNGTALFVLLENRGAGLPACESSAHPPRKARRLVMPIQMRRRSLRGFIINKPSKNEN